MTPRVAGSNPCLRALTINRLQEEKAKLPAIQPSAAGEAAKHRKPKTGVKVPASKRKATKDAKVSKDDDADDCDEKVRFTTSCFNAVNYTNPCHVYCTSYYKTFW